MIDRFYTTSIAVERLIWSNDSSAEIEVGSFMGHIQQKQPDFTQEMTEVWGKLFLVWCNVGTDVEVGDKLTIDTGRYAGNYSVKHLQLNAVGINEHLELTCFLVE